MRDAFVVSQQTGGQMPPNRASWRRRTSQAARKLWLNVRSLGARLRRWVGRPTTVVAIIGVFGLSIDLFWKPLTTGALVMLGLIALPWLLRIVKRAKIAGLELEAQSPGEVEERIEREAVQNAVDAQQPANGALNLIVEGDAEQKMFNIKTASTVFSFYERLAINRIAKLYSGTAKTDIRVGSLNLDAVIEAHGARIGVEVKNVSEGRLQRNRARLKRELRDFLKQISRFFLEGDAYIERFALVLIGYFPKDSEAWRSLESLGNELRGLAPPAISIRIFSKDDFDKPSKADL
jgi:hypothetical protein